MQSRGHAGYGPTDATHDRVRTPLGRCGPPTPIRVKECACTQQRRCDHKTLAGVLLVLRSPAVGCRAADRAG
eukprot:12860-Prymnesium_polylepis.1